MARGGKRPGAGRKPGSRNKSEAPKASKPARAIPEAPRPAFEVIDGGGLPEPDWSMLFADELDLAAARDQWRVIVAELRATEKLATANEHQIKRLVVSYVLYEIAARHVAEDGAVFPRKGRKQPAYNPWWAVLKDANGMASVAEAELTISPRRRNSGGKVQRKKPSQIGGGYLKSLPK